MLWISQFKLHCNCFIHCILQNAVFNSPRSNAYDEVKTKVQNGLNSLTGQKQNGTSGHAGETVLITGGSGFVAAHVLNAFLDRGYNVRTTVRSQSNADKVKNTHGHYGDKLSFAIVPEITTAGAFDEAVKGVQGVSVHCRQLAYLRWH